MQEPSPGWLHSPKQPNTGAFRASTLVIVLMALSRCLVLGSIGQTYSDPLRWAAGPEDRSTPENYVLSVWVVFHRIKVPARTTITNPKRLCLAVSFVPATCALEYLTRKPEHTHNGSTLESSCASNFQQRVAEGLDKRSGASSRLLALRARKSYDICTPKRAQHGRGSE